MGKFKDELCGKIMPEFCALRAKAYSYRLDDDTENKKRAYISKSCGLPIQRWIIKSQQRFRSNHHRVYTEEVNKIALSSNDDKRLQTFDRVTMFPYRTNAFKVCELKGKTIGD